MPETQSSIIPLEVAPRDLRRNIYDLSPDALTDLLVSWGEPRYRAKQVLHWLYKELVAEFDQMTNLPLTLRAKLAENLRLGSAELVAQQVSSDGWTRKVLLKMRDGNTVEAVLMLYYDRATACISSQVGCAMGCTFCATGQMGFTRNLTAGEIVEQVIWFNRGLRERPHMPLVGRGARYTGKPSLGARGEDPDAWFSRHDPSGDAERGRTAPITGVTNIVFMGMGEPLVNYANLWSAIRTLNSADGLGIGARRLTVSTVGIVPAIKKFAREDIPVNLAVSLHAPNDAIRSSFMPINNHYSVDALIAACRDYVEQTHRRITFEYVLIRGVNDSLESACELRDRLKGLLCHTNLIPLNPVPGSGMSATQREQVFAFQKVLEDGGVPTTVRIERGVDIAAACGQLKVSEEANSKRRSLNRELVQAHVQADLASQDAAQ